MNDDRRQAIVSSLMGMRSNIDAMLYMLSEDMSAEKSPACEHPRESRMSMTVMGGGTKWRCGACDFLYDSAATD